MPESGDLVGPYRLVSQLGKGAMGEVWRARDERLDRYVALKVLPADAAGDVERRARMLREARAAAAIRHRNVVTLFDIVNHHGDDILVMELVEGRTLSEALRKDGPPSLEIGLRWIACDLRFFLHPPSRGLRCAMRYPGWVNPTVPRTMFFRTAPDHMPATRVVHWIIQPKRSRRETMVYQAEKI